MRHPLATMAAEKKVLMSAMEVTTAGETITKRGPRKQEATFFCLPVFSKDVQKYGKTWQIQMFHLGKSHFQWVSHSKDYEQRMSTLYISTRGSSEMVPNDQQPQGLFIRG